MTFLRSIQVRRMKRKTRLKTLRSLLTFAVPLFVALRFLVTQRNGAYPTRSASPQQLTAPIKEVMGGSLFNKDDLRSLDVKETKEAAIRKNTTSSDICSAQSITRIRMAAVPATASTSTDEIFKATKQPWRTLSNSNNERGFHCSGPVVEYDNAALSANNRTVVACLLAKFWYQKKIHTNYNALSNKGVVPFTILKDPYFTMSSHYIMRRTWDVVFESVYPDWPLQNVSMAVWVERAWWRHNIFTKMLATDTQLIWTSPAMSVDAIVPTKEHSDAENSLGRESIWFQKALHRLRRMPFFGLHYRLKESFELFGFRLCFPVSTTYFDKSRNKQADVAILVDRYNQLDTLLLQEAELLFDAMVKDMREKQARGILCDLGHVLNQPQLEIGLKCTKE